MPFRLLTGSLLWIGAAVALFCSRLGGWFGLGCLPVPLVVRVSVRHMGVVAPVAYDRAFACTACRADIPLAGAVADQPDQGSSVSGTQLVVVELVPG